MAVSVLVLMLVTGFGLVSSQFINQPNQNGQYMRVNSNNNNDNNGNLNKVFDTFNVQRNPSLVKEFRQDGFAQQNLAPGNKQWAANKDQGGVTQAPVLGAQQRTAENQAQNIASNQNLPFNGGQVNNVQAGNSVHVRVQNEANVNQNINQQNVNQQNVQKQQPVFQTNSNQVNSNPLNSAGNDQQRQANVNNQFKDTGLARDPNTQTPILDSNVGKQLVVNAAQEVQHADNIAEEDRQRSARLERPVNSFVNSQNDQQRGIIKTASEENNNNFNAQQQQQQPQDQQQLQFPQRQQVDNGGGSYNQGGYNGAGVNLNVQNYQNQPERDIGGIRLSWDWTDFAISFDDYGGAEMKVRRAPHSTTGEPWPLPQYYVKKDKRVYKLDKDLFTFKVIGETCDIIQDAVERYRTRVLEDAVEDMYDNLQNAPGTPIENPALKYDSDVYTKAKVIAKVDIKIRKPCTKYPSVHSDESYDLVIKKSRAVIMANEVWGALRGLETFSHIVWRGLDGEDPDDRAKNGNLFVKETVISDYPRFPHRGILLDSSRHFFFKEIIFDVLDGMEQNKMNVLHWHIVDDQSFPYQSEVFPDLSRKGAFHPTFVYTQKDIQEIIDYARFRGIRVMPEFDTPGHTYSWGLSQPDLLTQCYQGGTPIKGYLGPIDPTKNSTYRFLRALFAEVLDTFKDQYIHLGGDEVPLGCWQSNPDVVKFGMEVSKYNPMPGQSQSSYGNFYDSQFDVRKVYEYYENRIMKDLREIGKHRKDGVKFVMWQEVMNNDLQLPNDTIIEVWMGDMADVSRAISMGYQVLYATCWYLDHVEYGTKWPKYYQCDPADSTFGYMIDEKKVLGGEACLWSEYIDNENMMTTLWPRASAVAERLWSAKDVRDLDTAGARLSEHRCRMLNRGLSVAQISGPDYCLKRGIGRSRDKYRTNSTCTSGRCVKSRDGIVVEVDEIEVLQSRKQHRSAECPKAPGQGGVLIFLGTVMIILIAVGVGVKSSTGRFSQHRICKNRTILILFISVLLIYFLCYTSIWMQVFDFSGSVHKKDDSFVNYRRH